MSDDPTRSVSMSHLLRAVLALFVLGHLVGPSLFDNHWSFTHWRYLPIWYAAIWVAVLVVLDRFSGRLADRAPGMMDSGKKTVTAAVLLFLLTIVFQFDSFLYGGGNLRVAQIAQAETIVYRWFEYGTVALVSWFYKVFTLLDLKSNTAAVFAWKLVSFLCTAAALLGAVKLAWALSTERSRRLFLFTVIFFGPQTLLYFGFIGIEPVVVAFSIWFAFLTVRLNNRFTTNRLLGLWGLTLLGIVLHHTLAYLVPAAAYLSFQRSTNRRHSVALAVALVSYLALFVAAYWWAGVNLEYSRYFLFLRGKNPFAEYGLFSLRHLGDFGQILFLAVPQVIVTICLLGFSRRQPPNSSGGRDRTTALLMSLSGATAVFVSSPINSVMFDFPRFLPYLAPLSFLSAVLLSRLDWENQTIRRFAFLTAVAAVLLPLAYLPVYTRINAADGYAVDYLERNKAFYRESVLAFRDAYFYNQSFDQASAWEGRMSVKAPEYLLFEGASGLAQKGARSEAIGELYRMDVQYTYWTEPKELLAELLLEAGQYSQARKIIDECRQLEPYAKEHLVNLYRYFRDTRSYAQALATIAEAQEIFPGDKEIAVDKMIVFYRSGKFEAAGRLADSLLGVESSLAYPHLIRGLVQESKDSIAAAVTSYENFTRLDAKEAALYNIPQRLDSLKARLGR